MKRFVIGIVTLGMFMSVTNGVMAVDPISMRVFPAFAPRGPISPSWMEYVETAIDALEVEAPLAGNRSVNPAAYEVVTGPVQPTDMMYTDYNSWLGMADPNPAFADLLPDFQNEFGNRIHFGLHIETDGSVQIKLDDLRWALDSNDETDYFDQEGSFAGATYNTARVGINYGPDGLKGGIDDIYYKNGEPGTLPVNELIYVGIGDGFYSNEPTPVTDQGDINTTLRDLLAGCAGCEFQLAGIYTLENYLPNRPLIAQSAITISIPAGLGGDFDHDGEITSRDKDLLTVAIANGGNDILFDVDNNSVVDFEDLVVMVHDIANTYFGDANCDGEFNSTDLIRVFQAGKYETGNPAVWSQGDWDGNGLFQTTDLIIAFQDGGYEQGPRAAVAAVPEPTSIALTMMGLGLMVVRARRRR
jgi:hypothetical protein